VKRGGEAAEFLARHTVGWEDVRAVLARTPVEAWVEHAGVPLADVERAVDMILAARSMVVRVELGIQQSRHSTLNSYLEKLLYLVTGNFGRAGDERHSHLAPAALPRLAGRALERDRAGDHRRPPADEPLRRRGPERGPVFHLRAPIVAPLAGTLPEPEIYARVLHAMGDLPGDDALAELRDLAATDRGRMMQRAFEMFAERPRLVPVAPMHLYRTLGPTLADGAAAAAPLSAGCQQTAIEHTVAVQRALETSAAPPLLGDLLFEKLLASRSGFVFTAHAYDEIFQLVKHRDGKVHLDGKGGRIVDGPRLNLITAHDDCDPIAATPYHKNVAVHLAPVVGAEAEAASARVRAVAAA